MLALLGSHIGWHLALALRLYTSTAEGTALSPIDALVHTHAASAAATDEISAELLLGMAYVESGYDPSWVSRVEGHKRVTTRYPHTRPPKRLDTRASLYCGVLQTRAASWDACLAQRNLTVA